MFTITKQKRHGHSGEARITVPVDITPEDRERLSGLAELLYGHYAKSGDYYVMSEVRGFKCWTLFLAGFAAIPNIPKTAHYCVIHPKTGDRYQLHEAVKISKIMEPVREVPAEAHMETIK